VKPANAYIGVSTQGESGLRMEAQLAAITGPKSTGTSDDPRADEARRAATPAQRRVQVLPSLSSGSAAQARRPHGAAPPSARRSSSRSRLEPIQSSSGSLRVLGSNPRLQSRSGPKPPPGAIDKPPPGPMDWPPPGPIDSPPPGPMDWPPPGPIDRPPPGPIDSQPPGAIEP
jgi:hypothetical protein